MKTLLWGLLAAGVLVALGTYIWSWVRFWRLRVTLRCGYCGERLLNGHKCESPEYKRIMSFVNASEEDLARMNSMESMRLR